MKWISRHDAPADHPAILQGADALATDGMNHLAIWWNAVPEQEGQQLATLGACEFTQRESAVKLLGDVAEKLRQDSMATMVIGPMNGNTWREYRAISWSDEHPHFFMEPAADENICELFTQAGFTPCEHYTSSVVNLAKPDPDFSQLHARLTAAGLTFRSLDFEKFDHELHRIFDLSLVSFAQNPYYTPICREEFIGKYRASRAIIRPELVQLAEFQDQLQGYMFAYMDPTTPEPTVIMKTLATGLDRRFSGLGSLLVHRTHQAARHMGASSAIHALQHASNKVQKLSERFGAQEIRRYALFSKQLRPTP